MTIPNSVNKQYWVDGGRVELSGSQIASATISNLSFGTSEPAKVLGTPAKGSMFAFDFSALSTDPQDIDNVELKQYVTGSEESVNFYQDRNYHEVTVTVTQHKVDLKLKSSELNEHDNVVFQYSDFAYMQPVIKEYIAGEGQHAVTVKAPALNYEEFDLPSVTVETLDEGVVVTLDDQVLVCDKVEINANAERSATTVNIIGLKFADINIGLENLRKC